jgi:hypothetical protein
MRTMNENAPDTVENKLLGARAPAMIIGLKASQL